jgi:hypothetical protein
VLWILRIIEDKALLEQVNLLWELEPEEKDGP